MDRTCVIIVAWSRGALVAGRSVVRAGSPESVILYSYKMNSTNRTIGYNDYAARLAEFSQPQKVGTDYAALQPIQHHNPTIYLPPLINYSI